MDGIIIVNKPSGYTSHTIVSKIRKALNIKKVGHTGTLDPLATGVLPILLGSGTRLSKYLINHDKEYIATIKLGVKTDTADIEGNIIETADIPTLSEEQIKTVLKSFEGIQYQKPPMYSAIKVNGKKLYEYARKGENIDVQDRKIEIYNIELLKYEAEFIEIKVACSKGTYIRSLCEDIAKKLGTIGTMAKLQRTQVGIFKLKEALEMDDIEDNKKIQDKLITAEELFKNNASIKLTEQEMSQFLNGVKLARKEVDGIYRIYDQTGKFVGLGENKDRKLKRDWVE